MLYQSYRFGVRQGKKVLHRLPKGIVLTSDDLAELGKSTTPSVSTAATAPGSAKRLEGKELTGEWSGVREDLVVTAGEEKVSRYVFTSTSVFSTNTSEESYVVLELRGCKGGPALVPIRDGDGELQWVQPHDRYMPVSTYLAMVMKVVLNENWAFKVLPHLNGVYLVRYQAAVREQDWRKLWDALSKPFAAMRTTYRRHYRVNKAPDMFFGVTAKSINDRVTETLEDPQNENGEEQDGSQEATEASTEKAASSDGVPFSGAADWLEFWGAAEIPQQRTFVDFAIPQSDADAPRRSTSLPDLTRLSDAAEVSPPASEELSPPVMFRL